MKTKIQNLKIQKNNFKNKKAIVGGQLLFLLSAAGDVFEPADELV